MKQSAIRRAGAVVAVLFSLFALSGCGGGGGGGSSTPAAPVAPGAPGAPGSTPAPGSSATPTPGPTPTTGTTPPPPGTQGSTMLPDTTGRFSLIQMVDQYGYSNASLTSSQIQTEAPHYDAVWGAFQPQIWNQYHPGMILSQYVIPFEDDYLISGHDLSWWQQNHPDWIMYACDSSGNPTQYNPWSTSGFPNDVPLNIHNPSVVNYELTQVILPYLQGHGLNAIAIDQVTFENFLLAPNPELGQPQPISGYYACGYYSSGAQNPSSFVRVYGSAGSSDQGQADQTFINDELAWVQTAYSVMHGAGMKVMINHPPVGATPSGTEATLLQSVDGVVDENGFSLYGQYGPDSGNPGNFTQSLSWIQAVQGMGKAVFLTDYYNCQYVPANCNATSASQLSLAEVDFSAATYAIANNGGLGLFMAPQGVGEYSFRPELTAQYGAPCGNATTSGNLYVRKFAKGLALVNNSSSAQNYTLPNHAYTDVEQNHITIPGPGGTITLNAGDGAVLLITDGSNGCT